MKQKLRNIRLYLRVTSEERELIKLFSELSGLTISEYMRRRAYNIRVVAKLDISILKELRRLGGLVKHINNESHGIYNSEMIETLKAIVTCTHIIERKLS